MPLDYFLASKKPLIYTGKFTRIVYADGKTGELVNFTDRDLSGELSFVEKPENKSVADQFMEIIDAKIYMMAPDYTNSLKYFNQCEFKKLYISSKIDLINRIDRDLYYKSLVGSDVVVFLSYRVTYQRGTEKFSTPIFIPSFGYNWNDGKPLPAEYLTIVQDSAQKAGFLMPQLKFCNKNYDSISTKSGLGISCDK
ncbi:hypothetical protein [Acidovorax sp. CF316]|uniref:hypothetical protein n=1 Tax=Acidovorax sp. CF316 TaxID=1144317 RepID=UPI0011B1E7C2|nr:hypothetical protein [Acidovorax sp. CF316]